MDIKRELTELIDAAYESGYYSAVLEKTALTKDEYNEYSELMRNQIARREQIRNGIIKQTEQSKEYQDYLNSPLDPRD